MDLARISDFLSSTSSKIVAIQVHRSLSHLSLQIHNSLTLSFPTIQFSIIADSPFSSCCSDYISAKHINATSILHYGYRCDSEIPFPVLHILEPLSPAFELLSLNLCKLPQRLFLMSPSESSLEIAKSLLTSKEILSTRTGADAVLYIGSGCCISSLIQSPEQNIWTLSASGLETHDSYQFISRRFHYISQVSECKVFGIIISSLTVYNRIAAALKGLLNKYEKSYYVIYVGKINALKLGNFQEIDMFVMVSCENCEMPDNKNLYRPVITTFELEIGLKGGWEGRYSTEFKGEELEGGKTGNDVMADKFRMREFKGLQPESLGSLQVEEGYSGIAMQYKSELG